MPRSLANQSWGGAWGMGLRARLGPQPLPPAALSFLSPGNSKSTLSLPSPEAMATAVLKGPCPGRGTPSTSPTASNSVPTNQAQGTVYNHEMPKISCQNEAVMVSSSVTKSFLFLYPGRQLFVAHTSDGVRWVWRKTEWGTQPTHGPPKPPNSSHHLYRGWLFLEHDCLPDDQNHMMQIPIWGYTRGFS